jgi:hypothetical protein
MFFKNLHFLSHNIDDRFSALIFTEPNPNPHRIWNPHLECGFRMRILETKTMRIHADSCGCGCGSATLPVTAGNISPDMGKFLGSTGAYETTISRILRSNPEIGYVREKLHLHRNRPHDRIVFFAFEQIP